MNTFGTMLVFFTSLLAIIHSTRCDLTLLTPKTLANFPKAFSNCSAVGDSVKVLNFKLSSNEYERGDLIVGNLTYFLNHNITGNITLNAWGKHGVVPYFGATLNLCDTKIITCPLKAGRGNVVFKYQLSQFQSIGQYEVHFVVTDENKKELVCLDFTFTIKYAFDENLK